MRIDDLLNLSEKEKAAEDAAKAYDEAVLKYHGEFGITNKHLGLLP